MRSLNQVKVGEKVEVVEIRAGRGLHIRLANMGIHRGTTIEVVSSHSRSGPVLVAREGMRLALGHGMASKIFVRPSRDAENEAS